MDNEQTIEGVVSRGNMADVVFPVPATTDDDRIFGITTETVDAVIAELAYDNSLAETGAGRDRIRDTVDRVCNRTTNREAAEPAFRVSVNATVLNRMTRQNRLTRERKAVKAVRHGELPEVEGGFVFVCRYQSVELDGIARVLAEATDSATVPKSVGGQRVLLIDSARARFGDRVSVNDGPTVLVKARGEEHAILRLAGLTPAS